MDANKQIHMAGWIGVDAHGGLLLPPDLVLMTISLSVPEVVEMLKSFRSVNYLSGEVAKA